MNEMRSQPIAGANRESATAKVTYITGEVDAANNR
jgi:hypothetical protein